MELSVLGRPEEKWIQLSATVWWDNRCRNWRSSNTLSCPGSSWPQGQGVVAERCESPLDLAAAVRRCSKKQDLEGGRELHRVAAAAGLDCNKYVAASLITMYSKCRRMELAKQVFDRLVHRNVVVWTSLILGYAENGESSVAMDLFKRMECEPDSVTFLAVLKACGDLACKAESQTEKEACLAKGIDIHRQIGDCGFGSDLFVASNLVHMYSKCGSMQRARDVFDRMISKTVVCWNSLILGYVDNGHSLLALDLFTGMDCEANSFTYVAALKACGTLAGEEESEKQTWLQKGIAIHRQARDHGLESVIFVANSLVDMYSKCGSMDFAREVFDRMVYKEVITWNTLILGYVQNRDNFIALDLFNRMDCEPDYVAYLSAFKACGGLASEKELDKQSSLERGILIHKRLTESGIHLGDVLATALMDMYSKCGSMKLAREVFDGLIHPNVVAWTVLIRGYVENGESSVALELFTGAMEAEPNAVTYVAVLKACGNLAALAAGQQFHAAICRLGLEEDKLLANTLIDFYSKCGSMNRAEELFNNMHLPDVASWSALISGFSFFGDSSRPFSLAKQMQEAGVQMDAVSLTCVLAACNHAGLVDEGQRYFQSAVKSGVCLSVEHYTSMIDMLGRANKLEEAMALVDSIPFKVDEVIWLTLLAACKKWKNLEVGKVAFNELIATGSLQTGGAPFVLMSDICAS